MNQKAKYRPPLTEKEVRVLAIVLKRAYIANLSAPPYHPDFPQDINRGFDKVHEDYCLQLMNKFSTLQAKIDNGIAKPAYTSSATTPAQDVLANLGGEVPLTQGNVSPGERRALAYVKYLEDPTSCTATEIADAQEHRFTNGLMEEAEATAYEARMWENI